MKIEACRSLLLRGGDPRDASVFLWAQWNDDAVRLYHLVAFKTIVSKALKHIRLPRSVPDCLTTILDPHIEPVLPSNSTLIEANHIRLLNYVVLHGGDLVNKDASLVDPGTVRIKQSKTAVSPSRFQPSPELAAFVMRGVRAHAEGARWDDTLLKAFVPPDIEDARSQLGLKLKRLIGKIANRLRHGLYSEAELVRNGRFSIHFQHALLDAFVVIPDESSPFLARLLAELQDYLQEGGVIRGNWGRLALRGDAVMIVANPAPEEEAQWIEAKRIK